MTFLVNTNNITVRHLTNLERGRKMENCTQLLIHQVLHLYLQRSIHLLRDLNIHPGQCGMLWVLNKHDGVSQKELAEKMRITPPSITVMIRKMEAEELIEKHQDEKDQRIARIYITDKGRKIAENMDDALHQLEKEASANMSEQEIMLLHRLLLQMKENLIKGEKD